MSAAAPRLVLLEPAPSAAWAPFDGARPIAEVRAGAFRIRERWSCWAGTGASAIWGERCAAFAEFDEPPVSAGGDLAGPLLVVRSDVAPTGRGPAAWRGAARLVCRGEVAGWYVPAGERWTPERDGDAVEVEGVPLRGAWDVVTALEQLLALDCAGYRDEHAAPAPAPPAGSLVLGDPRDVLVRDAVVEPGVVFDVRGGPVVIAPGAEVRHGTRLEGPVAIGPGTRVLGGHIKASAFGPSCVVRGEVASCSFQGYANKGHDGFVGHSVIGHWANLGALTTTSNLKNTYGQVRVEPAGHRFDTGRQFLGSLIGDHAKLAIGTMLATGTVIGMGANVFGDAPPRWVRPFAWGSTGTDLMTEDGFLTVAARVLPRRQVELTDPRRAALRAAYRRLTR